jgi:hypothetical protein
MNLYLLVATAPVYYDCYDSFVICAENEEEAREIAQASGADETNWGKTPFWTSSKYSTCELLTPKEKGVVVSSFNAG